MALISTTDIENHLNITLEPDGITLANNLINAVLTWAQLYCGFTFASGSVTDYFDEGGQTFFLSNAFNISNIVISTYDFSTDSYLTYTGVVRSSSNGIVHTRDFLPSGFQAVQISYTAGWSDNQFATLDLKEALVELIGLKFMAANGDDKVASKITAGHYTIEYDPAAQNNNDIPADILSVLGTYRRVLVL